MKRSVGLIFLAMVLLLVSAVAIRAEETIITHGEAISGEPKYKADFTHFDYADPNALKGGHVKMWSMGTYDSFNPFIPKGVPAAGIGLIYETLTVQSLDEPFSQYGLVAEKIEMPADRTWVIYHINPKARFHDGQPITAEDVVFSYHALIEKGDPLYKKYYADIKKVEALDDHRVRFDLGGKSNPELALIVGQITVLPKHYWENKDFSKSDLVEPLGSGPYKIESFSPGKSITYQRVKDYWGRDLPVNKGQNNFDRLTYDYYRDETVSLEAFKSGEYDFRQENVAKEWATAYDSPPLRDGMIIKEEIPNDVDMGMQCFVFNTRREIFKDERVRQALAQVFDFEWTNKNIFYGQYKRSTSYFSNSELAARGLPSPEELEILNPYKDKLPPEVFTQVYQPPKTDGSGNIRRNLRTAMGLLKAAGWEIRDGKLTNTQTGAKFRFEIMLYQPSFERIVLPYKKNLERLGITMDVRVVDTAQYINRIRGFDFDMMVYTFVQSESPGNEQRDYWSSAAADTPGSRNLAGVKNPVVDDLIELIITAPDRKTLITTCRALDRVLLWGHYVIPQWHQPFFRVAHWNIFSRPAVTPKYALGFNTWWVDPQKAKKVEEYKQVFKK